MKQFAQNYKTGELALLEVPVPACKAGGILVRSDYSLISMGTEAMKIHESKLSLIGKARARPDHVKKVMQSVAQQGPVATYKKVMNRLDSYTPLGYSLAGVVVAVGAGADEFKVGQRVACAGNKYALHAEYNWVPKNLCVPIPDSVSALHASFTTVGAIAMQGFRQADAKLGETACVIGLGLVGQILVQILHAAGLNVVGVDLSKERCDLAEANGANVCGIPGDASFETMKAKLGAMTGGAGADHIFLVAAGNTNEPPELAVELARDRARIVDIGKCRLDLPWTEYYEKELDFRFSRSYGPGRYDPSYEEGGNDYPIGYVRWTERRNMECIIDLLAANKLNFDAITSDIVPFEDAVPVYEKINAGELAGLGIVFRYPELGAEIEPVTPTPPTPTRSLQVRTGPIDRVRLGVIGCGNYATTMLLPHLKGHADVDLVEVATATSLSAANAKSKFDFERMSTDYRALLADSEIDAVLIATRHDSHSYMVCEALRAGKAVFVEKPLAISPAQLAAVREAIADTGNDRLMVGFNRRFSKILTDLKSAWGGASGPQLLNYTVNSGPLEAGSWYTQSDTQGSRFAGEGGHFIDTVSWWLGSDPVEVYTAATPNDPDNLITTLTYPDGSVAKIAYVTTGEPKYPKEIVEVFADDKVAVMHNFKHTEIWQRGKRKKMRAVNVDKGQKLQLEAFVEAVKSGGAMPTSLDSLIATTAATFAVIDSAASRQPERVEAWASKIVSEDETEADDDVPDSTAGAA